MHKDTTIIQIKKGKRLNTSPFLFSEYHSEFQPKPMKAQM